MPVPTKLNSMFRVVMIPVVIISNLLRYETSKSQSLENAVGSSNSRNSLFLKLSGLVPSTSAVPPPPEAMSVAAWAFVATTQLAIPTSVDPNAGTHCWSGG